MVIGFKKQFVEPILAGTKSHTIREDRGNRWKRGRILHMYTGGRFTKEYHEFAVKVCTCVQEIEMWIEEDNNGLDILRIWFEHEGDLDLDKFAIADGFKSGLDFCKYWIEEIEGIPGGRFKGKVIHWTDLRY